MNTLRTLFAFGALGAGLHGEPQRPPTKPTVIQERPVSRRVVVGATDIVQVHAKVGFTTMLILPPSEEIVEATCGDKENWIVNGFQNLAHVKPVREGSRSNLNLLTKTGNVYSFVLIEGSAREPDLKLFVESKDDVQAKRPVRYVSADELQAARKDTDDAKRNAAETLQKAKDETERQVQHFRAEYPVRLRFYNWNNPRDYNQPPFNVKAIFTDGISTFIKAVPDGTPTIFEWTNSDYHPVQVEYRDGTYIVPKVLKRGQLLIGKRSFRFLQ